MEESVLLGTKPLVDSIRHFIRDPSGVFSVWHLCECHIVQWHSMILFLPLEHKIHIFSPPCNILYIWPQCMISMGNHVKFVRFVLLAVSEEAKTWLYFFCSTSTALADNPLPRPWLFWISQKPHPIIVYKQYGMLQVVRKAFYIVEVWNPACCHGNKNYKLILQSTSSRTLL